MGVLDPLNKMSEELYDEMERNVENGELLVENLGMRKTAIVKSDPEDYPKNIKTVQKRAEIGLAEVDSEQKFDEKMNELQDLVAEHAREKAALNLARKLSETLDVEPDYDNPVESWEELGELSSKLENLPDLVNRKVTRFENGVDRDTAYHHRDEVYEETDVVDYLPIIRGVSDSLDRIEDERTNLMEHALSEHQRRSKEKEELSLPPNPVDWESFIVDNSLTLRETAAEIDEWGGGYGQVLHKMMEENIDEDALEVEQSLDFVYPEREKVPRPDAVGDLMVYDFKHMPREQRQELNDNGEIYHFHRKSIENIRQVNGYLHDLDMPVGMLVYVSSDMQVEEYVVEKHPIKGGRYNTSFHAGNFGEKYVHKKDDYDFDEVLDDL